MNGYTGAPSYAQINYTQTHNHIHHHYGHNPSNVSHSMPNTVPTQRPVVPVIIDTNNSQRPYKSNHANHGLAGNVPNLRPSRSRTRTQQTRPTQSSYPHTTHRRMSNHSHSNHSHSPQRASMYHSHSHSPSHVKHHRSSSYHGHGHNQHHNHTQSHIVRNSNRTSHPIPSRTKYGRMTSYNHTYPRKHSYNQHPTRSTFSMYKNLKYTCFSLMISGVLLFLPVIQ